ncbi:amidohydrolase family protein [Isoptericola croceus]|uniref:amidohydrolase family protein n=1 Tax=Isoptericola croceus TaxID=3031406 RepID=UPI0023F9E3A1|nr:amidohydrolase family protein [Isoptericola croceus]
MIIDAHHHLWDLASRPQPWTAGLAPLERSFSYDELLPQLEAAGVDGTVVVQTVASVAETAELLALAAEQPRLLGVVGWLDLTSESLDAQLAEMRALTDGDLLVGVRHQLQVEPDPQWLERHVVRRSLARLGEAGLTYDVVASPEQLADVSATVAATPGTSFVLDHAGKPGLDAGSLDDWRRDLTALATHQNVSVKVSGLVTEADWHRWSLADLRPAVETVLETFGAHRTMWGSDWPVSLLADTDYARWVEASEELFAGLSAKESAAVWGGTAQRVYRLTA